MLNESEYVDFDGCGFFFFKSSLLYSQRFLHKTLGMSKK